MKVHELLESLEGMPEDADVRLAHQPSWPLEYSIDSWNGVVEVELTQDEQPCPKCDGAGVIEGPRGPAGSEEEDEGDGLATLMVDCPNCDGTGAVDVPTGETVVYIVEGSQLGYLPGAASRELGWRD